MGVRLEKIITKLGWRGCCSVTERQWLRPLLRISVIGVGKILVDLRQWKKSTFQGEFAKGVSREHEVHTQGNIMQVFLGYVTVHRSQNSSSNVQEWGDRDGDQW